MSGKIREKILNMRVDKARQRFEIAEIQAFWSMTEIELASSLQQLEIHIARQCQICKETQMGILQG